MTPANGPLSHIWSHTSHADTLTIRALCRHAMIHHLVSHRDIQLRVLALSGTIIGYPLAYYLDRTMIQMVDRAATDIRRARQSVSASIQLVAQTLQGPRILESVEFTVADV